jgi:hypothetical protein
MSRGPHIAQVAEVGLILGQGGIRYVFPNAPGRSPDR